MIKKLLTIMLTCFAAVTALHAQTALLEEGFEGSFPPSGWTRVGEVGATVWESNTTYKHSGGNSAYRKVNYGASVDFLIAKPITIPATGVYELSFWTMTRDVIYYSLGNGRSSVVISTTGADPVDFTDEVWTPTLPMNGNIWEEVKIDLSAYVGQTIYIAFRYQGNGAHWWLVDDVKVAEPVANFLKILPVYPTIPYSRIPLPQLTFITAKAQNMGSAIRTNVVLSATVNNVLQGSSAPEATLSLNATTGDMTLPVTIVEGANNIKATVTADGTENDESLNAFEYTFTGARNLYALDNIVDFTTTRAAATTTMQGVVYHLTAADTLKAAMVALGTSTSQTTYTVAVYRLTNATTVGTTPVIEKTGIVKAADAAGSGWRNVDLTSTFLSPGSYYIAVRQTSTYQSATRTTPLVFDGNAAKQSYSKTTTGSGLSAISGYGAAAIRLLFAAENCGHASNLQVIPSNDNATFSWEGQAAYYSLNLYINNALSYSSPIIFDHSITVPITPSGSGQYSWTVTAYSGSGQSCIADGPAFNLLTCADPITRFPWTEGFENAFPPACWQNVGTHGAWMQTTGYNVNSGTGAAYHSYSSYSVEDWLISRPVQIPATGIYELSFYTRFFDLIYYTNGKSSLWISTSGASTSDFTKIWEPDPQIIVTTYNEVKLNLSAYAGQTIYLAFLYEGNNAHRWAIDDISIYKLPDTPEAPAQFDASRRTTTTVELTWTNPAFTVSGAPLTELSIYIERNGMVVYSANATSAIGQPASWTDNTSLTSATYVIYGVNNDGKGATATSSFCGTVFEFPWFEGFEDNTGITLPNCWTVQYPGAANSSWRRILTTEEPEFVFGTGAAWHMWGNGNYNDWMITPPIVLPASGSYELSFWTRNYTQSGYGKNSVWVSTTGNNAAANFTDELWTPVTTPPHLEWVEVKISLAAYAGKRIYIGFRYEGNYLHAVSIDNVQIEQLFDDDVSVEAIVKPETGASLNVQEPVSVIIRNKGLQPIPATSGLTVSIELDGVLIATEPVAVDIAPSATYQYTFAATLDLSAEQSYQVKAFVTLPGDGYAGNNVMETTVVNTGSTTTMGAGSPVTGCGIKFYDDGGTGNYTASQNPLYREVQTMTFFPETPNERIQAIFTSLSLSLPGSYTFPSAGGYTVPANGDTLYVYDGAVADPAHLIAALFGNMNAQMPLTFHSESPDGALTFVFNKNRAVAAAGWEADIICVVPPARDLRITNITAPPIGTLTANESVTVTVKNIGGQPVNNAVVTLTANCVKYQRTISLGRLEERVIVFERVNLSASGSHTITATADTTGDPTPSDNTRSTTTKCLANTQVLLFSENFDPPLRSDYVTHNIDGQWIANEAGLYGWPYTVFDNNEGWAVTTMLDGNNAALSNSYVQSPPEPVDRWLVMPAIELSINARLAWRAGSNSFAYRDSYEVYISTTGQNTSDFYGGARLLAITDEEPEWTNREVALDAYAGQTVYIAFRHMSNYKDILWLDDIQVYGIIPDSICSGETYRYEPPIPQGAGMSWSRASVPGINNGTPASGTGFVQEILINTTAQPIEVTYEIYTTLDGCQTTAQLIVKVRPQLSLTSSMELTVCSHETFSYTPTAVVQSAALSWQRLPATGIIDGDGQTSKSGSGDINEVLENNLNVPVTVTYRYTLDAFGCATTQDAQVIVLPRPTKPNVWITNGTLAFCTGDSIIVRAESTGAVNYQWVLDESITVITEGIYTPINLAAGTHSITVTAFSADECTSDTTTITVTVYAVPATPTITPAGELFFCEGAAGSVTLTAGTVTGAESYEWYK
ncbi:MAG: choice-of-anchor J domain-containing protein, partial [Prevotellaceae bacterium]|nr:choice-of-anchor J domain-containing protein [Prevotellaceae bacterium]